MTDILRASLWMIGTITSFTAMAIAGREVSFALDTFEIMLFRSILGVVVVIAVASVAGTLHQISRRNLGLHGVRNIAHFSGQNLWFYAITVIPLGQVIALEFTAPIWALLLAPLVLGERITSANLIATLLAFVGILIVTRPGAIPITPGVIAAGLAAVGFAFAALFTRKLTRTETITCILFYLTVMQAVFGLICAGYDGDITLPTSETAPWLVLIGLAGLVAHFCLTKALSLAPAAIVMPVDFLRLPVIIAVGAVLYAEAFDPWVAAGAALIIASNIYNLTQGQSAAA